MLKAEYLKIEYKTLLFEDLNFVLGNKEKVGLVGLNGSGKTTLMKIIAGLEQPDKGSVILQNEKLAYLPQEYSFEEELFVGEFLEDLVSNPYSEMYKVNIILQKLEFKDVDEFEYIKNLSPGQKMKLYLVKLLIDDPTILLLDEPTNHLDLHGIEWLETFIKGFEGIVIMISHDREFLNNSVNRIFELDEKRLNIFEGNYDEYLIKKENWMEERKKLYIAQERKRKQLEQLIENSRKISDGSKRGKAIEAAKKRMEREVTRNEINDYSELKVGEINIAGKVYRTKRILDVKNLSFSYGEKTILNDANFQVFGNEKIWILGSNGIGKSTLVKLLIQKLIPDSGEVNWGENITWEYFSQDQSHLPFEKTVMQYFTEQTNLSYQEAFGPLENMLFNKEIMNQRIEKLSPGQRARLSFAVFARHNYECLILDEPTNHLDLKTKEVIQETLLNFKGAVLLISHDRHFAKSVEPSRVITISEGKIVEV